MRFERQLALRNLTRRPVRSGALVLLAAFLSLSVFAGSLIVLSLQNGLKSYEARMGADIVVVPNEARSHGSLESILLQGIPGYFYMDASYLDKVRAIDGVEAVSPQFYLASASAGCCSVAVQIIGFDPDTDFSIQPWIRESYGGALEDGDIIVGSSITVPKNRTLRFYNQDCHVVASLDRTGTGLDTAVYANMNTIRMLMESSQLAGFDYVSGTSPDRAISSVMVKVKDGYSIESVNNDINIHVRHVEAAQAKTMVSSIAGGLTNVSRIIGGLTATIWILAVVILVLAFVMIAHERTKEFAILRVVGASQKMLSGLVWWEAACVSLLGAIIGVAAGALAVFPFSGFIHSRLDLPYLLPGAGTIAGLLLGSVLAAVIAGSLTSAFAARRISKIDTGVILREGA